MNLLLGFQKAYKIRKHKKLPVKKNLSFTKLNIYKSEQNCIKKRLNAHLSITLFVRAGHFILTNNTIYNRNVLRILFLIW